MYDLIIIGGGPAAAAATFYACEKRLNALMVYEDLGGKVGQRESLISYDQGDVGSSTRRYVRHGEREVAELVPTLPANSAVRMLISHTMHAGRVRHDRVQHIRQNDAFFSVETTAHGVFSTRAVIVATGATPRLLDVPGADQLIDRGMDYSITTYAQHAAQQQVAVIGSTPRALLGAAELAQAAAHVFVIIPEQHFVQTPVSAMLQQQHNVTFITGYAISKVIGERSIAALMLRSGFDTRLIPVQRAFVDLGLMPNSELVQSFGCTDSNGFIIVDEHMTTSVPGLFAAGDVTTAAGEQVLIAIGDGTRAARSAYKFILTRAIATQKPQERAVEH